MSNPGELLSATMKKTQAIAKKRAKSIFGNISSNHAAEDAEDNSSDASQADRVLTNGDYYTGEWQEGLPDGMGKYLWVDGCMYIGDWHKGKTLGKGRFSWPNGAAYEGEFKGGYMDGKGTYTGASGDIYKGQWVMNLKHGQGLKNYGNGDSYEGEWRRGLQEGQGKYQWKDGSSYIGGWKNGMMCGKGIFTWNNGNVYEGYWDEGFPKANGTLKWEDGSFYQGYWSKDPSEQNGSYYPSGTSPEGNLEWDPQDVYKSLEKCKIAQGEKVVLWPSQKKIAIGRSSRAGDDKPRRTSVDGRYGASDNGDASMAGRLSVEGDMLGLNLEDGNIRSSVGQPLRIPRTVKRQGETISRGHRNYELMLDLQLGIRYDSML